MEKPRVTLAFLFWGGKWIERRALGKYELIGKEFFGFEKGVCKKGKDVVRGRYWEAGLVPHPNQGGDIRFTPHPQTAQA